MTFTQPKIEETPTFDFSQGFSEPPKVTMPQANDNSDAFDFNLGMAKPTPPVAKSPKPIVKPPQLIMKPPPTTDLQKNALNFDQKK